MNCVRIPDSPLGVSDWLGAGRSEDRILEMSISILVPPSSLFSGYRVSFLGVIRPEREVDHSASSSAEVKNGWHCTSPPLYAFMY